jgi:hypothetical protein
VIARRLAAVARALTCTVLGAATLSSCATFQENDLAASSGDNELSQDELRSMLESDFLDSVLDVRVPGRDGEVIGSGVRDLLGAWIVIGPIEDAGLIDPATLDEARAQVVEQFGPTFDQAPAPLQDLLVKNSAINLRIGDGSLTQDEALGVLAGADVHVDPRYGRWDPELRAVVPLG